MSKEHVFPEPDWTPKDYADCIRSGLKGSYWLKLYDKQLFPLADLLDKLEHAPEMLALLKKLANRDSYSDNGYYMKVDGAELWDIAAELVQDIEGGE